MNNFKVNDRVYHYRYKEGYIESIYDSEYAIVEFDNYENLLDDNLVKVHKSIIKISFL